MSIRQVSLIALGLVALLTAEAQAQEPCGGLRVADGLVELGTPLPIDANITEPTALCLQAIAAELASRKAIRSVTVAARVSGDAAARQRGFVAGRVVADKLGELGLERARISVVAPAARPDEASSIQLAYVQRRSFRPVAQVYNLSGKAWSGARLGALTPVKPGDIITPHQYFETGSGSVAILKLIDGSKVRVTADTVLRVGTVRLSQGHDRDVQIDLLRGEAVIHASKLSGPFRLVTGNAIAGVRGTFFRLALPDDTTTRLETLGGTVDLTGDEGHVFVTVAEGSKVDYSGYPERPRPLLVAPRVVQPVFGHKRRGELLEWRPVSHAKRYRVEFAHDAQFAETYWETETTRSRALVGDNLTPGKWFWRVTPVDRDGYVGLSSKIYAFTVLADGGAVAPR